MSDPPPTLEQQYEALQAESTRQQIEAEQTLHDLSSKLSDAVTALEQAQATTQEATSKVEEEQRKRQEVEEKLRQLEQARQNAQQGDGEVKKQLDAAEKEKRELMQVMEKEQRDRLSVEETLTSLRALHTSLQTSHSELEANLASTTSTSRTSLLRLQTLQSTVTSLEADNTFLKTELERGRSEWSSYRREKHAEIAQLQSQLESKTMEEKNSRTSLETLKKVHEQLKEKHNETITELAKVREELVTNEGNFTTEMTSMRRLVELMEKREEERKKRVEDVEKALEEERNALAEKEDELRDQLLQERERGDALEVRYQDLREALERGNGQRDGGGDFIPGTPGSVVSDSFALSPSAQLAVRGQKSGRSYAEIYGEYIKMEEELAKERAETKRLGEILSQILGDIEERAPLLQEQRQEYERLSVEATQLASQLAQALTDRDNSERRSESFRLDVERLSTDNVILTQQLSDLGRQIRTLSRALAKSENASIEGDANDAAFDEEEAAILRRAEESGDTDSVVSAHLVTFRSINELQVQNQKLLKITRQMGQQLEKGEEDAAARRRGEENKAVEEAHELILRLKEEVESQRTRTEAYEKERDMFRRMLAQRGGASSGQHGAGEGGSTIAGSDIEASRLLTEVQANFDAYKNEISIDTQRLREDLAQAQKDASAARTELAKSKAQSEFMSERFRLLNETFELRESEIKESQKRAFELQQTLAKQDSSIHKMSEDLLELRSSAEQLRHENTNLKSEREVAKNVENRLVEENNALSRERAHLSDLMRNLQTMQNELERSGNDARKRLEDNVVRLESQASDMREKLNQAEDNNRQLALRKEIESKTFHERIDKLTSEYSSTRETLVVAQTSQEHLEQRVRDLVLQIEAKEEKLAIFEGRSATGEGEAGRTVEEQLQVTVAELRAELRSTKDELERAQKHVKQYQAIAETEGDSLRELTATYEEYKSSTEASLTEKDGEISSLRERLHSLTTDLTASNTQNSDLHRQIETARVDFEKERKVLEDEMVSLRSADQVAREAQLSAQDDMRRQAQIAKDAHEKYERELVAHAEDVKRLCEVKEQLESVRATIREHQTAAEVSKANLVSSEQSWTRQKQALEQELSDVRKRAEELKEQNATLAQHLETATAQASQLHARHAAVAAGTSSEGGIADSEAVESITASHAASVEQLREVIRYLRREKEIIDLQFDYSKQEAARLRQQLEFAERSLTEARQALTEERQKAGDSITSSAQHAELLESIHTAKLLRESNQTLRDENEANLRKVSSLDSQLRQAQAEIEPLKEQVRILQAEVESKQNNMRLLEEDNERWKTRNQTILAKYERIDPEELQVLKNEVEKVQATLAAVEAEKNELAKKIEEKTAYGESMKQNWQNGLDRFKALQTQARSTRDERNVLTKEVEELKAKLESGSGGEAAAAAIAKAQSDSQAALAELQNRITTLETEKNALTAQLSEQQTIQTTNDESLKTLQEKLATLEKEKAIVTTEKDRLAAREAPLFRDNKRMATEAKTRQAELEARLKEIESLKASVSTDNSAAIEAIVQTRLAELGPAPAQPTEEQIAEAAKEKIAAKEVELVAQRDEAVRTAVKQVTDEFEAQLRAAKDEIAKLQTTGGGGGDGAIAGGASDEEVKKVLENAKKEMEQDFEKVKKTMQEESVKREKEITDRLSAEIKKLQETASTSSSTAPPPNVDALVQQKLAQLEKERSAAQQQAIAKAVTEALEKQKATHEQILTDTKAQIEKQGSMKNNLLNKSVASLREKVATYQKQLQEAGITPAAPQKTTPSVPVASSSVPSASAPKPPVTPGLPSKPASTSNGAAPSPSNPPASNPTPSLPTAPAQAGGRGGAQAARGRGAARGARGAGQTNRGGRGGAANVNAGSPPTTIPQAKAPTSQAKPAGPGVTPSAQPASPGLTLRGAASGARGGVLGQLLGQGGLGVQGAAGGQAGQAGQAGAAKRQRDNQGDGEGDAKRPKGA